MNDDTADAPQLYLVTPPKFELHGFTDRLVRVLDAREVACLRLQMPGADAGDLGRAADGLRDLCHARDIAIVIADHHRMVGPHGLDGVHITDGRSLRDLRADLGRDAIIGSFCDASRHAGLSAGEAGADYVSFGPVRPDAMLGDGSVAEAELFDWWSAMIEVPVVAEGGLDVESVAALSPSVDFFAVGREIWDREDPLAALEALGL
ncbi:thiamine phosphate synthase [Roseobacter sp. HKCCA0434]|uniref:thiamine phosphate synthase n=1 Tax=Roseobacter sp. HKCCA0434 TaxID=3079297 RepID=UPI002905A08F|nr:thiamine phosphate synthase [Roseobacter sp. HKCCA0434]